MQISMELMSLFTGRADSGMGVRQRAGPSPREGFRFEKVFEEALAEAGQKSTYHKKPVEKSETAEKNDISAQPHRLDENPDGNIAAGTMGNQENVVFILEGDRESATDPETNADAVAAAIDMSTETVVDRPADTGGGFETAQAETAAQPPSTATAETDVAIAAKPAAEQLGSVEIRNTAMKPKTNGIVIVADDTAGAGKTDDGETGEVTARMPIIRTSERQENDRGGAEFSGNGDLSPLENENDPAPLKGQREKTYSATADAVRSKAGNEQEPVNNAAIPLAQGIKPEQFRADQVMKQAAIDNPVRAENLFDEMVSRIETMQTENTHSMTIQLKPDFMGKVALEIAMDAAGLHVKIDAANSDVRAMLGGQINALIESLENKGIEVVEVEVAYTGIDNGAFKEHREDHGQSDTPRRSLHNAEPADSATYYASLPVETLEYYLEDLDAGVSSVEYRA